MKTFTRWLLALLLVAIPMMAVVQTASANTELVPASRLVVPFVSVESGRGTFLMLTNVQFAAGAPNVDLRRGTATSVGAVHIEFYDKTCSRSDTVTDMSPGDLNQINVTSIIANLPSLIGFADIDVRSGTASLGSNSIQENVLVGTVIISDSPNDFALAYPMAASVGSAGAQPSVTLPSGTVQCASANGAGTSSAGCTIVTRNAAGNAGPVAPGPWVGRYEPFPTRLILPAFFAEGTDVGGPTFSSFLSVVSPADGNWYGGSTLGEAPGEDLTLLPVGGVLINAGSIMWDGCERNTSQPLSGHTVMGTLGTLFGPIKTNRANWTTANCAVTFPGRDQESGNPIGWIEFPNASTTRTGPVAAVGQRLRGLVGLFFENANGGSPTVKQGDVSRLWGDPTTITGQSAAAPCTTSGGAAIGVTSGGVAVPNTSCRYNMSPVVTLP